MRSDAQSIHNHTHTLTGYQCTQYNSKFDKKNIKNDLQLKQNSCNLTHSHSNHFMHYNYTQGLGYTSIVSYSIPLKNDSSQKVEITGACNS